MKILTGALRGQAITFKANPHLRPTSDKVRKAIFDMLSGQLEGKNILDLFAGTGALGLEALSSGAEKATFVETNKKQCQRIEENLAALGLGDRGLVLNMPAESAIQNFSREGSFFDIILMDPPYEEAWGIRALEALSASNILHEDSLVILEGYKKEDFPKVLGRLKCIRAKAYGDTKLVIYRI